MTETLLRAELRTVSDVTELDTAEAAELFDGMRAASVPLGDRARLLKVAQSIVRDRPLRTYESVMLQSGTSSAAASAAGESSRDRARSADQHMPHTPVPNSAQERNPKEYHRQLQSGGGGFSLEVAAIVFTGLIGMVGYVVQARASQKASDAQASLGLEAAEREKAEAKAGKQLERVQLQMAEWVRPLAMETHSVTFGWRAIAKELQLQGYLNLYCYEYTPQPTTPYIDILACANPTMFAAMGAAPWAKLPPEDIAQLAADPALRSRYYEMSHALLLPPLRRQSEIIATMKSHLNESGPRARRGAPDARAGRVEQGCGCTITHF